MVSMFPDIVYQCWNFEVELLAGYISRQHSDILSVEKRCKARTEFRTVLENSFLAINRQIIAQGGQAIIIYCQISLYIIGRQLAIVSPNKVPT